MDLFFIHGIVAELKKEIIGGFISKVYQLNCYDLLFKIRHQAREKNLFVSTHPDYSRLHLTEKKYTPPPAPPRFGAYLRKHLTGARIIDINQEPYERIVRFNLDKFLDAGLIRKLILLIELLGKKSNVFLLENGKILDALHRFADGGKEEMANNIPGRNYTPPKLTNKLVPAEVTPQTMAEITSSPLGEQWRAMVQKIAGLPPLLAREIELVSGGDPLKLWENFQSIWARYEKGRFEPQVVTLLNGQKILCPWPLKSLPGEAERFSSLNQGADNFYYEVTTRQQIREQKQKLIKRLRQLRERLQKRKENLYQDKERLTKDLQLKMWGELLVANYPRLKKGMKEIAAWDYAQDPPRSLLIPLDESLDPAGNVHKYFAKYKKAKRGLEIIAQRIEATEQELNYLESVCYQIEEAEDGETLEKIKEELREVRILSPAESKKKKGEEIEGSLPVREFRSQEGLTIYCGKHNLGNEYLLRHLAKGDDLWFHAQGMPGAHVLLKVGKKEPNFNSIVQAAMIAAYYSKGKEAGKIPVDYTEVKNIHKPKGSRPGYVTYFHQKTIFVSTNKDEVERLRRA